MIAFAYVPAIHLRRRYLLGPRSRLPMVATAIVIGLAVTPFRGPAQPLVEPRPEVDPLVGRWELRGKWSAEGISSIVDFMPGGWYSQTLVVRSRLRYDYDGTKLVLTSVDTHGQPMDKSTATLRVEFVGDTLVATAGSEIVKMARLGGSSGSRGIIGRWVSTNDEGKGVVQDFDYDGFVHVAVTLSGEAGRYSVSKNKIVFEPRIPVSGKRRTKFTLKGNKLLLAPERGDGFDELVRLR